MARTSMTDPLRIAWLTTGRGPGSYGALEYVLQAIDGGLPVNIEVVFVNRDPGEAEATDSLLELVRAKDIPLLTRSSVRFRRERGGRVSKPGEPLPAWRTEFDNAVAEQLAQYEFDLGVMFGYMLIATEPLYSRFRFINDHPALPNGPVGTWQEVIREVMDKGLTESGCMMNVVTGDVDRGPVVSYCRYPIRDDATAALWREFAAEPPEDRQAYDETPLFAAIRRRGVLRERPFLVETLRAIAAGTLAVPPPVPVDLTEQVEQAVARFAVS
ncbi:MAG: phosphoglycerate transporter [Dehalococcoidia bacterium]|nr:phosphoglycerate transporter [Dehalococcoidia bacterium]